MKARVYYFYQDISGVIRLYIMPEQYSIQYCPARKDDAIPEAYKEAFKEWSSYPRMKRKTLLRESGILNKGDSMKDNEYDDCPAPAYTSTTTSGVNTKCPPKPQVTYPTAYTVDIPVAPFTSAYFQKAQPSTPNITATEITEPTSSQELRNFFVTCNALMENQWGREVTPIKNKETNTMYIEDFEIPALSAEKQYLRARTNDVEFKKLNELRKAFGLVNDEPPTNFIELLDRIAKGQYILDEAKAKKSRYDVLAGVTWRAPALKEDRDSFDKAEKILAALTTATQDAVTVKSEADGLAALQAFETTNLLPN